MSDYRRGHVHGYGDFRAGLASMFFCMSAGPGKGSNVMSRHANAAPETVGAEDLDYARGYIDGFMRAEDDSHE